MWSCVPWSRASIPRSGVSLVCVFRRPLSFFSYSRQTTALLLSSAGLRRAPYKTIHPSSCCKASSSITHAAMPDRGPANPSTTPRWSKGTGAQETARCAARCAARSGAFAPARRSASWSGLQGLVRHDRVGGHPFGWWWWGPQKSAPATATASPTVGASVRRRRRRRRRLVQVRARRGGAEGLRFPFRAKQATRSPSTRLLLRFLSRRPARASSERAEQPQGRSARRLRERSRGKIGTERDAPCDRLARTRERSGDPSPPSSTACPRREVGAEGERGREAAVSGCVIVSNVDRERGEEGTRGGGGSLSVGREETRPGKHLSALSPRTRTHTHTNPSCPLLLPTSNHHGSQAHRLPGALCPRRLR